jgi:hypothetical protein
MRAHRSKEVAHERPERLSANPLATRHRIIEINPDLVGGGGAIGGTRVHLADEPAAPLDAEIQQAAAEMARVFDVPPDARFPRFNLRRGVSG